jgi:hypothetical protein
LILTASSLAFDITLSAFTCSQSSGHESRVDF